MVTDLRVLFAWRVNWPPHAGEWTHDALSFDEITRWSEGRRHDERPILRLDHPVHRRLEWAPAHRFLWSRWGNTTALVPHEQTTFSFARRRDPVFRAMKRQLELGPAGRGEPFVEELPGTREERASRTVGVLYVPTRFLGALTRTGWRLRRLDEELHHGRIT